MAENRLVGSLVLRTYDISPNSNTLSTITANPTYVDLIILLVQVLLMVLMLFGKMLISEHVLEKYIVNTINLI